MTIQPQTTPFPVNDKFQADISDVFQELYDESESPTYLRMAEQPWQSAKKVRIHFWWGDRNSAKSSSMEESAQIYYEKGLNIWHLWGARSYENLFWAVNHNCAEKWEKALATMPHDYRKKLQGRLHCKCHRAYPILLIYPDYIDFDMDSIYRYEGINWKSYDEYKQAVKLGLMPPDITKKEKKLLFEGKLRKPIHLLPKHYNLKQGDELIKLAPITVPRNALSKEVFRKQFTKYAIQARKEHRIIVNNPSFYNTPADKFSTIGEIFKMIPELVNTHFIEPSEEEIGEMRGLNIPVPKHEWNKWEKGYNKVCIVLNELRTLAPNSKYSPEVESSSSKRPIVDLIPELRHMGGGVWFLGDLQNPDDLNQSVRPQANNVVIKRATKELLGNEWTGFFTKIEDIRKREFTKWGYENEFFAPPEVKHFINLRFPRIEELPPNKGYVVYRNGEFFLETFNFPVFHHRKEGESFTGITGIKWTKNLEKLGHSATITTEIQGTKSEKINEKKIQELVILHAIEIKKSGKTWNEVHEQLQKDVESNVIQSTGIENLSGKHLCNKITEKQKWREKLNDSLTIKKNSLN